MLFETQLCIAKNILLCLQQNLSQYWEHQYPMNSTSYNLRHKENDNHTYHLYMYIIYIKIIFIRLPEPLMLPVGENKGELSAVADPDGIRRRGGGGGSVCKKFSLV